VVLGVTASSVLSWSPAPARPQLGDYFEALIRPRARPPGASALPTSTSHSPSPLRQPAAQPVATAADPTPAAAPAAAGAADGATASAAQEADGPAGGAAEAAARRADGHRAGPSDLTASHVRGTGPRVDAAGAVRPGGQGRGRGRGRAARGGFAGAAAAAADGGGAYDDGDRAGEVDGEGQGEEGGSPWAGPRGRVALTARCFVHGPALTAQVTPFACSRLPGCLQRAGGRGFKLQQRRLSFSSSQRPLSRRLSPRPSLSLSLSLCAPRPPARCDFFWPRWGSEDEGAPGDDEAGLPLPPLERKRPRRADAAAGEQGPLLTACMAIQNPRSTLLRAWRPPALHGSRPAPTLNNAHAHQPCRHATGVAVRHSGRWRGRRRGGGAARQPAGPRAPGERRRPTAVDKEGGAGKTQR
jgi:hypothetical protein